MELDFIGNHDDGVALELVGGVERRYAGFAVDNKLSGKVDIVECAGKPYLSIGLAGNATEEALSEVMHELDAGPVGADAKVDSVMYRRYEAIDECL